MGLSSIYNRVVHRVQRQLGTRNKNQLTILMYHAVVRAPLQVYDWCFLDAASFRSQMHYLKRHFAVISLSEAVERLRTGGIQQPTAVITFDDGFQNNYDVAWPILRAAAIPATIFLTTGLIGTSDTAWFCRLNRAVAETRKTALEWNGRRFDLSGPGPKGETASAIKARLKEFPHPRLLTELRKIVLALGADPDRPVEVSSPFRLLSHAAIAAMAASGIVEFGAHTHS
ncbi:MAG: polysaccharide deacetylase family protein, partial [Candidatus Binatia bacterium]